MAAAEWYVRVGRGLQDRVSSDRPMLSLVVWTLKREVRAFGGCLGMYRR